MAFLLNVFVLLLLVSNVIAIWPLPANISTGNKVLWVTSDVKITYSGIASVSYAGSQGVPADTLMLRG